MSLILQDSDLFLRKYSLKDLEQNIHRLSLTALLQTQILTSEFCAKYIWGVNDKYAKTDLDENIYMRDILNCQPHISEADIYREMNLQVNIIYV
jgi:hypothetical protein